MARFEVYQDEAGKWRWRLRAENNAVIASSNESFSQFGNAERAVMVVRQAVTGMDTPETRDPEMAAVAKAETPANIPALPPALAGFLRGLALAVILGIVSAAIGYLSGADVPPEYAAYAAVVVVVLRSIEGYLDQLRGGSGSAPGA